MDVKEVGGKEAGVGSSSEAQFETPLGRRMSPVDDLKHRLSLWGESNLQPADSDEEGSEYELLLDPNLPEEYTRPQLPSTRPSLVDDQSILSAEEKASKILDEDGIEEDSPYPEVRAAVHNYDVDMPCNTVSGPTLCTPSLRTPANRAVRSVPGRLECYSSSSVPR